MSAGWIAAAAVSVLAHVGFAALVETADVENKPRPPIEMQLAKLPKKVETPPEPPKPPPPPPPKPKLVKHVAKSVPPPPPPPETQRVGISEDATTDHGEVAVATGVTTDGVIGTGTSMDKTLPPPPPEPPAPPPPPAPPKPKFFPSYEVTQLPKIKKPVSPEIPEAFRQAQREALVVVEVEIDIRGRVVGARVMRHADYGLDDAALVAAKATEFEPALMGTQPVPVRYQLPYRFKVRG